jgi:hypothetical protein
MVMPKVIRPVKDSPGAGSVKNFQVVLSNGLLCGVANNGRNGQKRPETTVFFFLG